ncbi:MAG TPA: glycine betaine ABC transporter substrate-binding protein [Candidatus Angelobacter sp.]|nr:glycine betaine ABC transporter substrate-binding protein [Candidatus Angelobacter sp.]
MDRRRFVAGTALLLAGCVVKKSGLSIGSKNFTEQLVLGELLAQYLGRFTALPIEKRFYLAGTYICHQALLAGRIDMYVEYTGTALVAILKEPPSSDHAAVFNIVKEKYVSKFGVEALPSLGFDNTFAMVMRGSDARRLHVKMLSDAAAIAPQLRLGVGYEFLERADGYKGLVSKYGLQFKEAPRVMDLGLLYRALQNNQVDLVAGSNTDGLIAALDLVVLEDDRRYFPPYDAVPLVRRETLQRYPAVAAALQRLSGRISAEDMRRMNYAVDGEKRDAAAVVKDFIDKKLIV